MSVVDDKALLAAGVTRARARLARGSKSFALAGKLLPEGVRDDAAVLYAWCRRADDAIDDVAPHLAVKALEGLRADLASVYDGRPQSDPELHAFQEVVRRRAIPRAYAEDLLAGMEMDVDGRSYQTLEELRLYCYRVAGTVGLMMAHVMELADARFLPHAAELGMAMQLTNIARDVEEDWRRGRLYVPARRLPRQAWEAPRGGDLPVDLTDAFKQALRFLLDEAAAGYRRAEEGLWALPWRSAIAATSARRIYAAIGTRLEEQGLDVKAGRAVVSGSRKLVLALGSVVAVVARKAWRQLARRKARPALVQWEVPR